MFKGGKRPRSRDAEIRSQEEKRRVEISTQLCYIGIVAKAMYYSLVNRVTVRGLPGVTVSLDNCNAPVGLIIDGDFYKVSVMLLHQTRFGHGWIDPNVCTSSVFFCLRLLSLAWVYLVRFSPKILKVWVPVGSFDISSYCHLRVTGGELQCCTVDGAISVTNPLDHSIFVRLLPIHIGILLSGIMNSSNHQAYVLEIFE